MPKPTRDEMIEYITQIQLESMVDDHKYLRDKIRSGWTGLDQLSDEEVEDEYNYLTN